MANNKKGQEEWVNFILVSLLFLILIGFALSFVFLDLFKKTPYQQIISEKTNDLTFTLLVYLKTPVEDKIIPDLIVKSYYQNNYEELNKKTTEILNAIGKNYGMEFILLPDNKKLNYLGVSGKIQSYAIIPLPESKSIKIIIKGEK